MLAPSVDYVLSGSVVAVEVCWYLFVAASQPLLFSKNIQQKIWFLSRPPRRFRLIPMPEGENLRRYEVVPPAAEINQPATFPAGCNWQEITATGALTQAS